MRAARDAKVALETGFTSVREVGGYGDLLSQAVEEGTVTGPHIYGQGRLCRRRAAMPTTTRSHPRMPTH